MLRYANYLWGTFLALAVSLSVNAQEQAQNYVSLVDDEFEGSSLYWSVQDRLKDALDVPFFFNVVSSTYSPLRGDGLSMVDQFSSEYNIPIAIRYDHLSAEQSMMYPENRLGLQLLVLDGSLDRMEISRQLGESGALQTGDIVLSFRSEWHNSLTYAHVQLGVSHAGLVWIEERDGRRYARNLDMPLDQDTVGNGYFDSKHYIEAPKLHVLRPKGLTDDQKENIAKWAKRIMDEKANFYGQGNKMSFNSDYATPKVKDETNLKFIVDLANLANNKGMENRDHLTMFCSEMVWAVLSLRDCDPDDGKTRNRLEKYEYNKLDCMDPIFEPMPVFGTALTSPDRSKDGLTLGMADGMPLVSDLSVSKERESRNQIMDSEMAKYGFHFEATGRKHISSGHIAVETQLREASPLIRGGLYQALSGISEQAAVDLIAMLEQMTGPEPDFFDLTLAYYQLSNDPGADKNPLALALRQTINQTQAPNYSPTAFMVHALAPQEVQAKRFDYISTIIVAEGSMYNELKQVSIRKDTPK